MSTKKYPFSARKHAHDIELVANRSYNLWYEARERGDWDDCDRYWDIHEKAEEYVLLASSIRDQLNYQYTEV